MSAAETRCSKACRCRRRTAGRAAKTTCLSSEERLKSLGYLSQEGLIISAERPDVVGVHVDLGEVSVAAEDRDDDLGPRLDVACKVTRVASDVSHDHGRPRLDAGAADSSAGGDSSVFCGTTVKGFEHQRVAIQGIYVDAGVARQLLENPADIGKSLRGRLEGPQSALDVVRSELVFEIHSAANGIRLSACQRRTEALHMGQPRFMQPDATARGAPVATGQTRFKTGLQRMAHMPQRRMSVFPLAHLDLCQSGHCAMCQHESGQQGLDDEQT
jgi:hypothetical protein